MSLFMLTILNIYAAFRLIKICLFINNKRAFTSLFQNQELLLIKSQRNKARHVLLVRLLVGSLALSIDDVETVVHIIYENDLDCSLLGHESGPLCIWRHLKLDADTILDRPNIAEAVWCSR